MQQIPPLTPFPLDLLLGRVAHEWDTRGRIFDLPSARFWKANSALDLGMDFMGRIKGLVNIFCLYHVVAILLSRYCTTMERVKVSSRYNNPKRM